MTTMRQVPLALHNLCTVREAAGLRRVSVQTIRNWILAGLLRLTEVGEGKRKVWLLDLRQVKAFFTPAYARRRVEEQTGKPAPRGAQAMIATAPLQQYGLRTIREAATIANVTVQTVRNWVRAGRLRVCVAGAGRHSVWLIGTRELRAFIAPKRGRPDAVERDRRKYVEAEPIRQVGLCIPRRGAKEMDPTALALARRLVAGDQSARNPLIDRLLELGKDKEAARIRMGQSYW